MSYLGKRSIRSLLALTCVSAAGLFTPESAVARETGCGSSVVVTCDYGCRYDLCQSLGCTWVICDQSYQCGFFMVKTTCGGGAEE